MNERDEMRDRNDSRHSVESGKSPKRGNCKTQRSISPDLGYNSRRDKRRDYSRSRSGSLQRSYRKYHSRSWSNSPLRDSRYSRSRSRSYSPRGRRRREYDRRSRSPLSSRRRHTGSRDEPDPSRVLGVFGLSLYTTERELDHIFSKFGPIEKSNSEHSPLHRDHSEFNNKHRSQSRSPSLLGPGGRAISRSRTGSPADDKIELKNHSYSRSRSSSPRGKKSCRRYSRTRSRSPRRYRDRYSRSLSYSPRRSRYDKKRSRHSHSRSPMSNRRRHTGSRDNPEPGRVLGVFGLSLYTTERELHHIFSKFGPIEKTGRSRGFGFVYFDAVEDAKLAKEECSGMEIDGRRIRVDYSVTQRPHTPTPGIYMGKPTYESRSRGYYRSYRSPSPYHRGRGRRYDRSRSRSYSPPRLSSMNTKLGL